tara:strand:+ start:892 stop:1266 length:375 start_codon:yes stop_codon:yes gene_type:complete
MARQISSNHGLSLSQYLTLNSISSTGISMTDLSQRVGIDNSTLTRNINILIKKSLVTKERSLTDARGFTVELTKNGDNIVDLMEKEMNKIITRIGNDLDPKERENLIEIISKLNWKLSCYFNEL